MIDRCVPYHRPASVRWPIRELAAAILLAVLLGAAGCGTEELPAAGGGQTPPSTTGTGGVADGPAATGGGGPAEADSGGGGDGPAGNGSDGSDGDGGDGGARPAGGIPEACTLLTPAGIESVIGVAVSDGEPQGLLSYGDQTACAYRRADDESAFVLVLVNGTGDSFDEQRETADTALLKPSEDVSGVGDDAYWIDNSDTVTTHVGETYLQVTYAGGDRGTVTGLARAALAGL